MTKHMNNNELKQESAYLSGIFNELSGLLSLTIVFVYCTYYSDTNYNYHGK